MRVSVYHSIQGFSHITSLYTGSSIENQTQMHNKLNTLPSDHVRRCDCYAMRCLGITYFDIFTHSVLCMCFSAVLYELSCQGYQHLEAGPFQTPTFFEPYDCYKVTIDSGTPFFFLWSLP